MKLTKCTIAKESIEFLGYIIDKDGVRTDPKKVAAIAEYPVPTNVTDLKAFLGLASYYWKFIKGFSTIASPLFWLMRKDIPYEWTNEQQDAMDTLKRKMTQAPILRQPEWTWEFILQTDASKIGLGAVLMNKNPKTGEEHVIAYASRGTRGAEQTKYTAYELECLAVVWGLETFDYYVYGRHIKIKMDNSAVTWLKTKKDPKSMFARWIERIGKYDYTIIHVPGTQNGSADALSRIPRMETNLDNQHEL